MNFKRYDELEAVELWAHDNNCIASEEELSERFDQYIDECCDAETKLQLQHDEPMLNEMFCNYSDSLCKDDEIHQEQYNQYEYIGKYRL